MMKFHEFSKFSFVGQITQIMKSADIGRENNLTLEISSLMLEPHYIE